MRCVLFGQLDLKVQPLLLLACLRLVLGVVCGLGADAACVSEDDVSGFPQHQCVT